MALQLPVFKKFNAEDLSSQLQRISITKEQKLDIVVHTCNPSTYKAKAGGSPGTPSHPSKRAKSRVRNPWKTLSTSLCLAVKCSPWVIGGRMHCSFKNRNNVLTLPVVFLNSSARSPRTRRCLFPCPWQCPPFPFCYNSDGKNSMLPVILKVWAGLVAHVSKSRQLEGQSYRITRTNNWKPTWAT